MLMRKENKKTPFKMLVQVGTRDVGNDGVRFFHPGKTSPNIVSVPEDVSYGNARKHYDARKMIYLSDDAAREIMAKGSKGLSNATKKFVE